MHPVCTPLGPPNLVSANGTCAGNVLTWTPGSGTNQSYSIYRKDGSCGGTYTKIASGILGTTYTDTTAVGGTQYAYVIRSSCDLYGFNESSDSNCRTATRLVSPVPTISGASQNSCPSTTVTLSTQTGKSNYQWYKDGQAINGANSSSYVATATGNYSVSYTDLNGCSGTSSTKYVEIIPCTIDIKYHYRGNFVEITGDGDSNFERGEKYQVTVYIKNFGNSPATNTVATITGNGVTICGGTKNFETINAGESKSATFEFVISPTFSPCGGGIYFNVINKSCIEKNPAGANEYYVFGIPNVGQYVPPTSQEIIIQPSSADAWIRQDQTSYNGGTTATMDVQNRSGQARRSVIYFDISSIPSGATINSATLELYATTVPGTAQMLEAHRITQSWTETGVTWANQPTYTTPTAQVSGGTTTGWKIWDVKSTVEGWYNGTYTNYGFLIKCSIEDSNQARLYQFATREYGTQSQRPILRVNYTLPGSYSCSYVGSGSCGVIAPPMMGDGRNSTIAMKLTKLSGNEIKATWDSSSCSSDHAVVLYGNIGSWTSYAGAPDVGCNLGSNGIQGANFTISATNVWFNLVWVNSQGAGGHPGVNSQGQKRNLNSAGLCGITSDDHSDSTCD